ncbi:MAG: hypothetical protein JWR38_4386 [Mucilaginibacter sp.]|nr:hypothetical protein [Mucilaginibacter sp.]
MVRFPVVPGVYAASVIESIGPGVLRLQVGEKVVAVITLFRLDGAQATLIVASATSISIVPMPKAGGDV